MIVIAGIDSPVGPLAVASRGERVCGLWFGRPAALMTAVQRRYPDAPVQTSKDPAGAVTALRSYFAGQLDALESIPVE